MVSALALLSQRLRKQKPKIKNAQRKLEHLEQGEKMKKTTSILLTLISVALMGCKEDKSPPKNAIKHSLAMLNENRVSEFRASLTGQASQQMASNKAVENLRQKLSQIGQTEFGNENVLNSSTPAGNSVVVYRVEVKANRDVVGTVDVTCVTSYTTSYEQHCERDEPIYTGGGSDRDRDSDNPPRYDGRNDDNDRDDRDRDHDGGHIIPGDSQDKPDPNDNRDPNRPPRFPGMIFSAPASGQQFNQQWGRCYDRPVTSSSTDCKVSQINL